MSSTKSSIKQTLNEITIEIALLKNQNNALVKKITELEHELTQTTKKLKSEPSYEDFLDDIVVHPRYVQVTIDEHVGFYTSEQLGGGFCVMKSVKCFKCGENYDPRNLAAAPKLIRHYVSSEKRWMDIPFHSHECFKKDWTPQIEKSIKDYQDFIHC